MAGRKRKPVPAELNTISLFSGLTPLEEAERAVREEFADEVRAPADRSYDGTRDNLSENAARWIGLDAFSSGDDVFIVEGPKGAVITLIFASSGAAPEKTIQFKLSLRQWKKMKALLRAL